MMGLFWMTFDLTTTVTVTLLLATLIVIWYYSFKSHYSYWEKLGVSGPSPIPIFGNLLPLFRKGVFEFDKDIVQRNGKVFGLYEYDHPVLFVADPELLKEILVKNFDAFVNKWGTLTFTGKENYGFRRLIVRLEDDHWRHVRNHISPTFSTSKLKMMMDQITTCANILANNLKEQSQKGEKVDIRRFVGGFTMDTIARTAFGLDIDSQKNPDNPFVTNAKRLFKPQHFFGRKAIVLLSTNVMKIMNFFKIPLMIPDINRFFVGVVNRSIAQRKADTSQNNMDFLQLMLENKVENDEVSSEDLMEGVSGTWNKKGLTLEDIHGQSLGFFAAGYETMTSILTHFTYILALRQDVQDKLLKEIDEVLDGQEIAYDQVNSMVYLDLCTQEILRLYPPNIRNRRKASRDTMIGNIPIKKGTQIYIPIYDIMHDPEYWPDPDTFIPERFTPEEKAKRSPYVYLPFGIGPRHCVAMRLALLEMKVAIATILQHMTFHVCDETVIPLTYPGPMLNSRETVILALKMR